MSSPFRSLGVPVDVVERLTASGITKPFPIQAATLPDALRGRDVCGSAPTGSGKTIAFGIPLVARVASASPRRPRGLVLVPTRELAVQVARELRALAGPTGRTVMAVYGGVALGPQIARLAGGVDILVACPGRLGDLVARKQVALDAVELVVIDEADRMADMGFLPDVRRLLDSVGPKRQTLLFSATLDGEVDVLVRRYQRDPVRHDLHTEDRTRASRHVFWKAERDDRLGLLAELVRLHVPAIVFCRTKHGVDRLHKQLARLGVDTAAIHGDRSQAQRSRALERFSGGTVGVLIATDVAARGIHVEGVAVVVHYDPAASDKDYIHRSGRTGRAGNAGLVVSFVGRDQQHGAVTLQRQLGLDASVVRADPGSLRPERRDKHSPATAHPRSRSRRAGRRVRT